MIFKKPQECLSYCVGCFGIMVTGAVFAIPVYINALKEKFSYKQWIVELMPILCVFGFSFVIPAGLFCAKFGPLWTSLIGLTVSGAGYFMQWSTNFAVSFYTDAGLLQVFFHFLIGFGYGFLKMAILMTCIDNFTPKHRAKAVGFIGVMSSLGAVFFSYSYGFFINGHIEDAENQDLEGYFVFSGILVVCAGVLCMMFIRPFSVDLDYTSLVARDSSMDNDTNLVAAEISTVNKEAEDSMAAAEISLMNEETRLVNKDISLTEEPFEVEDLTVCKLFTLPDFQMFMLGSILISSAQISFLFNVNTLLKSLRWEEYMIMSVMIIAISQALSKIVSGYLSDILIDRYPRTTILLMLGILQTIAFTLCIFLSDKWVVLLSTIIIVAMTDGGLWSICGVVLREFYGKTNFGRNYGVYATLIAVCAIGAQTIFGWMYQQEIPDTNEINCYGKECFTWQFVLESLISFVSVLLLVGVYRSYKSKKN